MREVFFKVKGPLAYEPCRLERTSLLSTESPEQNYRGFLNLLIILLVFGNIRTTLANLKTYGL